MALKLEVEVYMLDVFIILASMHIGGGDYNEVNPGLALRYDKVVVGVYDNSFSKTSTFAGYDFKLEEGNLEYGIITGGVTGYEHDWTIGGVTAFAAPYVSYEIGLVKPTILVLGNAVTFSVGMEF